MKISYVFLGFKGNGLDIFIQIVPEQSLKLKIDMYMKRNMYFYSLVMFLKMTYDNCLTLSMLIIFSADDILKYVYVFPRKQALTFHAIFLLRRQFA